MENNSYLCIVQSKWYEWTVPSYPEVDSDLPYILYNWGKIYK